MENIGDKNILIIVESPTKAKTIKKFLPPNCTVIASNGHIRDLDKDKNAVNVEKDFAPHYIIPTEKKALVKKLKEEVKKSDYLLLATDEDREGESISWHLLQVLKPKVDYKRMVFHEITKKAILKALEQGKDLDFDMVHAQEARRIVDRLFGYDVSSIVGQKLSSRQLSAGRVQSPGLKLTVEREKQRILFNKSIYFDAKATLNTNVDKTTFEAKLTRYKNKSIASSKNFDSVTGEYSGNDNQLLLDENDIKEVISSLKSNPYIVSDIVSRPVTSKPGAPFITSTLQQEAIKKLHFSSKETMRVAQKLYESGLITYMRTDSPFLSQEGINGARNCVKDLYGQEYLSEEPRQFKAKNAEAQEAHEAIRPSGEFYKNPHDTDLSGKDLNLYTLIWSRTIASQMAEAKKKTTTVKISCKDALFSTSGTQIVFPGYLRAYVEGKDDPEAALDDKETLLPPFTIGQKLSLDNLEELRHETKPPARFTEASLVHDLEAKGIGRPSTYASIIDTLLNRKYLVKEGSALIPTFVGFAVCNYLMNFFPLYVDYDFTRKLESQLDEVAKKKKDKVELLEEFYLGDNGLKAICQEQKKVDNKQESKTLKLPQISEENPVMIGPFGPYILGKEVEGKKEYINLPKELLPGTITDEDVKRLIKEGKPKYEPLVLGKFTDDQDVLLCEGRFGPYWQVGHDNKNKPKRSSVPSWMQKTDEAKDFNNAMKYLSLPRALGEDEEGNPIVATKGKYGPYINCNDINAILNRRDHDEQLFNVTKNEAIELLKGAKNKAAGPNGKKTAVVAIKDFGPIDGENVKLHFGRYGYYLKQGKTNIPILDEAAKKDEELAKNLTEDQIKEAIAKKKTKKK